MRFAISRCGLCVSLLHAASPQSGPDTHSFCTAVSHFFSYSIPPSSFFPWRTDKEKTTGKEKLSVASGACSRRALGGRRVYILGACILLALRYLRGKNGAGIRGASGSAALKVQNHVIMKHVCVQFTRFPRTVGNWSNTPESLPTTGNKFLAYTSTPT